MAGSNFQIFVAGIFHEFRKGAVEIDAYDSEILADVRLTETALLAVPAIQVHLRADEIAGLDGGNFFADALYNAAKFMTEGHGRLDATLRPAIPTVDVQVRAADRGGLDAHKDIGRANRRNRNFLELQTFSRLRFAQRPHSRRHSGRLLAKAGCYGADTDASTGGAGTSVRSNAKSLLAELITPGACLQTKIHLGFE